MKTRREKYSTQMLNKSLQRDFQAFDFNGLITNQLIGLKLPHSKIFQTFCFK